jgi:PIN domain nuclease of toxin-antitoxin system
VTDATEAYVADTHALVWLLSDPAQLGIEAARAFREARDGVAKVWVPTMVFVEMQILEDARRRGFPASFTARAKRFVDRAGCFEDAVLDRPVVDALVSVPHEVRNPADRVIAATALALGATLLTKDTQIVAWGGVRVAW